MFNCSFWSVVIETYRVLPGLVLNNSELRLKYNDFYSILRALSESTLTYFCLGRRHATRKLKI